MVTKMPTSAVADPRGAPPASSVARRPGSGRPAGRRLPWVASLRLAVAGALLLACGAGPCGGEPLGVGIIAGDPTGLCAKTRLARGGYAAAAVAWTFRSHGAVHLHADYLRHRDLTEAARTHLDGDVAQARPALHYGLGGQVRAGDQNRASLRLPIGLTGFAPAAPVDFFVELVPLLDLAPATRLDLGAAVGARYYF